MGARRDGDDGQAVPLALALAALAVVLTLAFGAFAGDVVDAGPGPHGGRRGRARRRGGRAPGGVAARRAPRRRPS